MATEFGRIDYMLLGPPLYPAAGSATETYSQADIPVCIQQTNTMADRNPWFKLFSRSLDIIVLQLEREGNYLNLYSREMLTQNVDFHLAHVWCNEEMSSKLPDNPYT